ncbi:MAG: Lrp/AsnC family transcriptional regulator [Chloroflexi bacterium]|nr:Lrp/AsnC family transcriptional regulator [Chloroflexota bacterium]
MTADQNKKDVLRILEKDARTTPEEIAAMTRLHVEQVKSIVEEAERDRTILRYKTIVNWRKVERDRVWALIEVRVQPERDRGFDALAERIYRFPEAHSVYLVSGQYDLAVLVAGESMQEVASFVSRKLATLPGVAGTVTHFVLHRYKEEGEVLEDGEDSKRLPMQP